MVNSSYRSFYKNFFEDGGVNSKYYLNMCLSDAADMRKAIMEKKNFLKTATNTTDKLRALADMKQYEYERLTALARASETLEYLRSK